MMTAMKSGRKTVGVWAIVYTLVFSICLIVLLVHPQEAFAEKKTISGSAKGITRLARAKIPVPKLPVTGWLTVYHLVLDSTDPDWNDASYYFISYTASAGEWNQKGFGVITHPGGDQTFLEFEEKYTATGSDYTGEVKEFFLNGTGKFKGIRGRWNSNWKRPSGPGDRMEEWKVEYEMK